LASAMRAMKAARQIDHSSTETQRPFGAMQPKGPRILKRWKSLLAGICSAQIISRKIIQATSR